MGNHYSRYTLEGMIEFDEAYFTVNLLSWNRKKKFAEKERLANKM